jgi:ribonuclease HI
MDLAAPEKLKFFIWTACQNSLPTRTLLNRRGMYHSPSCPRCPTEEETFFHCIRDCGYASRLWISLGFDNINFFMDQDISSWLRRGVDCDRSCTFLAACWWIWRARNSLCMEDENMSMLQVKREIYRLASLINRVFNSVQNAAEVQPWVSWHPMAGLATVLNVDGSSLGIPGSSGFGGVLRHSDGSWLYGFAGHVGISSILHAELLALYYGLSAAWEKDYRHIICYSDSTLAIQLVTTGVSNWHLYAALVRNIQELLARDWTVQVCHTWREANAVADFLAKMGARSNVDWQDFFSPPDGLQPLLQADASRVLYARR